MAMAEEHHDISVEEQYVFQDSTKRKAFIAIIAGVGIFILGILLAVFLPEHSGAHAEHGKVEEHHFSILKRIFASIWFNNVYFTGIAVIGIFFVSVQYVAQAGWSSIIKRIPESFAYFLPFTGAVLLIIFLAGIFVNHGHDSIFHWTHDGIMDKGSPEYDEIIAGKQKYLNLPFYLIRTVAYFVLWYWIFLNIRKFSLAEDVEKNVKYYEKQTFWSIIFIIVFAVTSSTSAWDWVLSIDTHWYSTMFGWYVFASWHVTGLAVITLTVVLLKEQGYLKAVNSSHLHDLGKFMFAFSIFWTYIWVSQFLLIYYAGFPEETVYFKQRWQGAFFGFDYTGIFFINLVVNFIVPFLGLMTRDAKRHMSLLKLVACFIIVGHWLDFYLMVMPGTVGKHNGFLIEIGTAAIYAGSFVLVMGTNLAKNLLIAKNHPMLEESLHHDI